MNKFTIFTIIFSAIVIITVGELVINDYLDRHSDEVADSEQVTVDSEQWTVDSDEEIEAEEPIIEDVEEVLPVASYLNGLDYSAFGIAAALKDKNAPELVFQFLSFDDDPSDYLYYELFDGEEYVGSLYEINCSDPTQAFTIYTDMKQSGSGQPETGSINEVNNYGDASFYFNHTTKTTSVFAVVLKDNKVYAFNYPHSYHSNFKELIGAI